MCVLCCEWLLSWMGKILIQVASPSIALELSCKGGGDLCKAWENLSIICLGDVWLAGIFPEGSRGKINFLIQRKDLEILHFFS